MCQYMNPCESRELANSTEKNLTAFKMLWSRCGGTEETARSLLLFLSCLYKREVEKFKKMNSLCPFLLSALSNKHKLNV